MMRNLLLFPRISGALFSLLFCCVPVRAQQAPIAPARVSTAIIGPAQQEIRGWGMYPSYFRTDWSQTGDRDFFQRPAHQKMLLRDSGITLVRVDLQPRLYDETKADGSLRQSALDDLTRHLRIAREHGVRDYIASVWSAPTAMKDPPQIPAEIEFETNGVKTKIRSHLREDREAAYVAYLVAVLRAVKANGLALPVGLSIQNELTSPVKWDGTVWTPPQYRRVIKKMRAALDGAGMKSVALQGPEAAIYPDNEAFFDAGFELLKSDRELNRAVAHFAAHSYDQWGYGDDLGKIKAYASAARAGKKPVWMTEWSIPRGNSQIEWTLNSMRHFARDLVLVPNNYWFWWRGWVNDDKAGAEDLVYGQQTPVATKQFLVFSKLWNAVRPGFWVHPMQSDDPDLKSGDALQIDMVAFKRGAKTVVLLVNSTAGAKQLQVRGLGGKSVQTFVTTETQDMAPQPEIHVAQGAATFDLPPQSASVVVSQ